jgi:uncharacterized protein Yka (UPF0111/DUF47 family)
MISLQRLLGKEEKFFDLLEASAEEARASAQLLIQLLKVPDQDKNLNEFKLLRRKDKKITEQITAELCRTFVTPLEREDIEALSRALYKIPKTVEKVGEHMLICPAHLRVSDFTQQARMIEQATEAVLQMVKALRHKLNLEKVKDLNDRLQLVEGEADQLILDLTKDLYSGKHDALKVLVQKELYALIEKVVDRCRDAGNVIFQIVLKYS